MDNWRHRYGGIPYRTGLLHEKNLCANISQETWREQIHTNVKTANLQTLEKWQVVVPSWQQSFTNPVKQTGMLQQLYAWNIWSLYIWSISVLTIDQSLNIQGLYVRSTSVLKIDQSLNIWGLYIRSTPVLKIDQSLNICGLYIRFTSELKTEQSLICHPNMR